MDPSVTDPTAAPPASVSRALATARRTDRLAHGLLFTGAAGSGRERAARALAAGLLCVNDAPLPWGCGRCRACHRALAGSHPDVHLLIAEAEAVRRGLATPDGKKKPSADILVDGVRELVSRLRTPPYEGAAQVAIVIDAQRMTPSAQNALLKTLEEPAPRTFLVLLAPHERTLLPTIASRCLRLRFPPPPAALSAEDGLVAALWHALVDGSAAERLEAAEAAGKERTDVDAALAALQQRLGAAAREDAVATNGGLTWRRAAQLLEAVTSARDAIQKNASVPLCLEELLFVATAFPPAARSARP